MSASSRAAPPWVWTVAVFIVVLVADLLVVAVAGTDIPFHDQWGIEGGWLYPRYLDGSLRAADLLRPFSEHRIAWTHMLNLGLFVGNGQWDPLVELIAIGWLRATAAATVGYALLRHAAELPGGRAVVTMLVALAFLPLLAWHNVLWGIESHAAFVLLFSVGSLVLLGAGQPSPARLLFGVALGLAAQFAMAPGALVPVALLAVCALRMGEARRFSAEGRSALVAALGLLGLALALRAAPAEHDVLAAPSIGQFCAATIRLLAWPHAGGVTVAAVMNAPLLVLVGGRLLRRRRARAGEDVVVLLAAWSAAVGLATAWARGGSAELATGVPSRYADFLIVLPLANAWAALAVLREPVARGRGSAGLIVGAWLVFLCVGWGALSAEMLRRIVLPRARDREAPVRLMREYQLTGDASVFAGQPRLLVPHPRLEAVRAVLRDPRMQGRLPPSLQPEQPLGPLSRAARAILPRQ